MTKEQSDNLKGSNFHELAVGGQALHSHLFAPGDVWLAKSRLIPHQIMYGKKMLSAQLNTDAQTMLNPEKNIRERLGKIHIRKMNSADSLPYHLEIDS